MPANRRLWSLAEALVNPNHGTPLSARMPVLSRRVGECCRNQAAAEGVITRNRSGTENHTDGQLWREVADVMRLAEGDTGLVAGKLSGTKDRGDPAHGKVSSPAVQRGIAVCGASRTVTRVRSISKDRSLRAARDGADTFRCAGVIYQGPSDHAQTHSSF